MKTFLPLLAAATFLAATPDDPPAPTSALDDGAAVLREIATPTPPPGVDLALCLDTSGSMTGLIDAARAKLWAIVNDLALATPTPRLRVALLTFGNDTHDAEDGWVAVQTGFTEDLDLVSQQLFALTTDGGTELVGRVLHAAEGRLDWSEDEDSLRLVVVAGNESADQDQTISFRDACRDLVSRDILVNSIYCGPLGDGIDVGWREVATRADGQFANIDQDHGTVVIETPFDLRLSELNTALNGTYVPFGERGRWASSNQIAQDSNALAMSPSVLSERTATKAGKLYRCNDWDLVDACEAGTVELVDLVAEDLPEELRGKTVEEQTEHLTAKKAERDEVSTEIQALQTQRQDFISAEMEKRAVDDGASFDRALRDALRAQAGTKGLGFPDEHGQVRIVPPSEVPAVVAPPAGVVGPQAVMPQSRTAPAQVQNRQVLNLAPASNTQQLGTAPATSNP